MRNTMLTSFVSALLAVAASVTVAAAADGAIDNGALAKSEFRDHARTFGLVYTLPKTVNDVLDATIRGPLKEKLLNAKLDTEAQMHNIPHVTVVHIHNADPATPEKMLAALPKLPPVLDVTLKTFYTTEAAKGAGHPWWLDLGIVKEGKSFEEMMAFNTAATAALAPLRDGPLPRCTGPVYAVMSDAAKDLVRTVGVSGVNVVKDGKELRSHNPHNTLVYSMAKFTPELQAQMNQAAKEFNQILPDGIPTSFKSVSIVELGFAGNVLREIYRISLEDGSVLNVATGKMASLK
ncbi:conserved hypothetical protein [Rhodopseudomonas palustris HaA2]|uniref:DUF2066 domain-containing protein n=1 Tax=Rhodopseudomonas palustris (strain HaA2) TaxID=316058 RepID=Q2J2Y9_RHOP2|nr:hypothetical protein [Rhodopseudomonas palustris]ABD05171.1 conserved hypothetical protein [Rhodopseudomonas palustris HaA2]